MQNLLQVVNRSVLFTVQVSVPRLLAPLYRLLLVFFPPFVSIYLLPEFLVHVVVLLSIYPIYVVMEDFQDDLYGYSITEVQWFIATPLYGLFLVWALFLNTTGSTDYLGSVVFGVLILVVVSFWPIYRRKKNWNKKRKIPFSNVYLFFGMLVAFHQAYLIWSSFL